MSLSFLLQFKHLHLHYSYFLSRSSIKLSEGVLAYFRSDSTKAAASALPKDRVDWKY
jgi:hypothetical protein